MKPTPEQEAIFACQAPILKVSAFAGTGKTTTLRGFAEANPSSKILYVAFNKAIQQEAERKFPRNVTAKTAHSIAYAQFGRQYGSVHEKLQGDIKPFHVLPFLASSTRTLPVNAANLYGGRVIETIKSFLVSGDPSLDLYKHVSIGDSPVERAHFTSKSILEDAVRIWALMQDVNSKVPMLHDGYLKLFQLSGRTLPFDITLLDEAQDTNPVTQAIVDAQQGRKVYVGDRHQAIYGFRGASNAMALIRADAEFHLTGSFRFGDAVADVANKILSLKDESVSLRGLGGPSHVGDVDPRVAHAFIARGNSALFSRAVQALSTNEPFAFVGDLRNYRFDLIEDTYRLFSDESARDTFLRSFTNFDALVEYADLISERALPPVMPDSEQHAGNDRLVILSSAHRSKGMEFDHVQLADDFMDFFDEDKPGQLIDFSRADQSTIEEINLQYVAATRARKVLEVGDKLNMFLEYVEAYESRQHATPSPA